MEKKRVFIYDTTLREGCQKTGIAFSIDDKLRILDRLTQDLGISMIEAGWPGSNPKDIEFFKRIEQRNLHSTNIYPFSSTRRKNIKVEQDKNLLTLFDIEAKQATIVGKSWDLHVHSALETSLDENLQMIEDTVSYLTTNGMNVIFDAEHFFDGYKNNNEYALQTIKIANEAGAEWIVLCDTNGGLLPYEIESIIKSVKNELPNVQLGIHAHNDSGMANANALKAWKHGVEMIQGTINGFGERCGNTDLTTIIPIFKLKLEMDCIDDDKLKNLTEVSHYVYEMGNLSGNPDQPFVGKNAFSHKGGIHISAMLKNMKTYEHINPELVGNKRNIKISELAGRSSILHMADKFNIHLTEENPKVGAILRVIKEKENQGYSFEGAEGTLEILMRGMDMNIQDPNFYRKKFFELEGFRVLTEMYKNNLISEATIKVKVEGQEYHTAAEGNGPVNALDNALKKALVYFYPSIKEIKLSDFKVRIINQAGTASKVRVLAETYDKENSWGTIGTHGNIIVASWDALVDSYIYKLLKDKKNW
ncbi:MAG: citramalate synthase [Candidatus Lokiarchaeota archaeon]|nr:citramalate synthase [Candidatus Lokiarchaeota archaeon]MBD3199559.1 citramalate synthase [Candidatus Lokiarchaeota archaeon]